MIDFHSHILPGIDDGAKDVSVSLKMLENELVQGVDTVVLTPHFYHGKMDFNEFFHYRNEAYNELLEKIKEENKEVPELLLGAEVALSADLPDFEHLDELCIQGTKIMLLELPYQYYNDWVLDAIFKIISKGYTPVMAHLDRFISFNYFKAILDRLLSMEVEVQINADALFNFKQRKFLKSLLMREIVPVLGSDTHDLKHRTIKLEEARKRIKKKFGEYAEEEIIAKPYSLLKLN